MFTRENNRHEMTAFLIPSFEGRYARFSAFEKRRLDATELQQFQFLGKLAIRMRIFEDTIERAYESFGKGKTRSIEMRGALRIRERTSAGQTTGPRVSLPRNEGNAFPGENGGEEKRGEKGKKETSNRRGRAYFQTVSMLFGR